MARVLMVIAPAIFRDEEYSQPKAVLEARGAEVITASRTPGICHGKLGMTAEATVAIAEVEAADYDAVVFVGGGGAEVFFDDPAAHRLARRALEADRVLGAICIAPSILARAGLLQGVRATAFGSQRADLVAHGAIWTGRPVEVDGAIVTANGPDAARDFGMEIADTLGLP
ncbi:MAG: DJ-1/PfpI family protein [Coriobacteriia bacterium]|nr:DJ-1/PfpI family protein [Coriobacteriia bacterium]